jgi:hypothetical protein
MFHQDQTKPKKPRMGKSTKLRRQKKNRQTISKRLG